MKNIGILLSLFLGISYGFCQNQRQGSDNLPLIDKLVNDFEDDLLFHQETILDETVKRFHRQHGYIIVVMTVSSMQSFDNLEEYSLALTRKNNFGDVWIIVSKAEKAAVIRTDGEASQKLSTAEAEAIVKNVLLPEISNGKCFQGILKTIGKINAELQ